MSATAVPIAKKVPPAEYAKRFRLWQNFFIKVGTWVNAIPDRSPDWVSLWTMETIEDFFSPPIARWATVTYSQCAIKNRFRPSGWEREKVTEECWIETFLFLFTIDDALRIMQQVEKRFRKWLTSHAEYAIHEIPIWLCKLFPQECNIGVVTESKAKLATASASSATATAITATAAAPATTATTSLALQFGKPVVPLDANLGGYAPYRLAYSSLFTGDKLVE